MKQEIPSLIPNLRSYNTLFIYKLFIYKDHISYFVA